MTFEEVDSLCDRLEKIEVGFTIGFKRGAGSHQPHGWEFEIKLGEIDQLAKSQFLCPPGKWGLKQDRFNLSATESRKALRLSANRENEHIFSRRQTFFPNDVVRRKV